MRRSAAALAGVLLAPLVAAVPAARIAAPAPRAQSAAAPAASRQAGALDTAIGHLGSFDFDVRTEAARTVRRADAAAVVPLLKAAALGHSDEYVRFRALVLLTGFGDEAAGSVVRQVMTDRNDRLRAVAYGWFEHHPQPDVLPALVAALAREESEFVRPELTRALTAAGESNAAARDAVLPLVVKGADFFRGALIEALGDYRWSAALPAIEDVAKLDGPLQEDAINAIGKIGDRSALPLLASLQQSAPEDRQPALAAAICLIGQNCPAQERYLERTLAFAAKNDGYQPLLRAAAHALGMLAAHDHPDALNVLLEVGGPARDPARAPIALAVGLAALRDPLPLLTRIQALSNPSPALGLLRDAFDMLSEDYEEERFYVALREAYWAAPADSPRRRAVDAIIKMLEF